VYIHVGKCKNEKMRKGNILKKNSNIHPFKINKKSSLN
jgi:hypothetical protein